MNIWYRIIAGASLLLSLVAAGLVRSRVAQARQGRLQEIVHKAELNSMNPANAQLGIDHIPSIKEALADEQAARHASKPIANIPAQPAEPLATSGPNVAPHLLDAQDAAALIARLFHATFDYVGASANAMFSVTQSAVQSSQSIKNAAPSSPSQLDHYHQFVASLTPEERASVSKDLATVGPTPTDPYSAMQGIRQSLEMDKAIAERKTKSTTNTQPAANTPAPPMPNTLAT